MLRSSSRLAECNSPWARAVHSSLAFAELCPAEAQREPSNARLCLFRKHSNVSYSQCLSSGATGLELRSVCGDDFVALLAEQLQKSPLYRPIAEYHRNHDHGYVSLLSRLFEHQQVCSITNFPSNSVPTCVRWLQNQRPQACSRCGRVLILHKIGTDDAAGTQRRLRTTLRLLIVALSGCH